MKINRRIFLLIISFSLFLSLKAHTVWIETVLKGELGRNHRVELNFGEFSMKDKTPVKDWLEGLSEGIIQLTNPDGTVVDLSIESSDSCYVTMFIPEKEGWYRVHYDCLVAKTWRGTKLHYQSIAWVCVGSPKDNPIENSPFKNGVVFLPALFQVKGIDTKIFIPVRKNNSVPERIALNVLASNGWRKNYYRLKDGNLEIRPLCKGGFLLNFTEKREFCPEEIEKMNGVKGTYSTITYFFKVA